MVSSSKAHRVRGTVMHTRTRSQRSPSRTTRLPPHADAGATPFFAHSQVLHDLKPNVMLGGFGGLCRRLGHRSGARGHGTGAPLASGKEIAGTPRSRPRCSADRWRAHRRLSPRRDPLRIVSGRPPHEGRT
jgi:hypothetical protein